MASDEALKDFFANMANSKRLMHAHFYQALRQFNVSQAQAHLLFMIEGNQPVSFKRLAMLTSLTPGAITQLVNPLVERGYITRTPDPKDRRVVYIALSAEGEELMLGLQGSHEKLLRAMLETLSDEEVAAWISIQGKMLSYLKTAAEKESKAKEQ